MEELLYSLALSFHWHECAIFYCGFALNRSRFQMPLRMLVTIRGRLDVHEVLDGEHKHTRFDRQ
jgi:hypothetical protein